MAEPSDVDGQASFASAYPEDAGNSIVCVADADFSASVLAVSIHLGIGLLQNQARVVYHRHDKTIT